MENKKSLIGRTTVTFICDECGKEGIKTKTEYERNLRLGRKNYCCRECSVKEISSYTSPFKEDQTILSSQGEMSDAQAGN